MKPRTKQALAELERALQKDPEIGCFCVCGDRVQGYKGMVNGQTYIDVTNALYSYMKHNEQSRILILSVAALWKNENDNK